MTSDEEPQETFEQEEDFQRAAPADDSSTSSGQDPSTGSGDALEARITAVVADVLNSLLAEYEEKRLAPAFQSIAKQVAEREEKILAQVNAQFKEVQRAAAHPDAIGSSTNGHSQQAREELDAQQFYQQATANIEAAKKELGGDATTGGKILTLANALLPLVDHGFDRWMQYQQVMFGMRDPFQVFNEWRHTQPDLTRYLAMTAAPRDPLEAQVPHMLARNASDVWQMAYRAGIQAGRQGSAEPAGPGGGYDPNPLGDWTGASDGPRASSDGPTPGSAVTLENRPSSMPYGSSYERPARSATTPEGWPAATRRMTSFRDLVRR